MMYVLQVVRQNGTQMLVTILFAFMVVYVFAVWSFSVSYFRNQYAIIDQKAPWLRARARVRVRANLNPNPNPNPDPNPNPNPNPGAT